MRGGGKGCGVASDEGHVLTGAGPFFISKSKQRACGGLEVMGKEETEMLIRAAHTSPDYKTTREGRERKRERGRERDGEGEDREREKERGRERKDRGRRRGRKRGRGGIGGLKKVPPHY